MSAGVRVSERRSRLLGLDAPVVTKSELTGSLGVYAEKLAAERELFSKLDISAARGTGRGESGARRQGDGDGTRAARPTNRSDSSCHHDGRREHGCARRDANGDRHRRRQLDARAPSCKRAANRNDCVAAPAVVEDSHPLQCVGLCSQPSDTPTSRSLTLQRGDTSAVLIDSPARSRWLSRVVSPLPASPIRAQIVAKATPESGRVVPHPAWHLLGAAKGPSTSTRLMQQRPDAP